MKHRLLCIAGAVTLVAALGLAVARSSGGVSKPVVPDEKAVQPAKKESKVDLDFTRMGAIMRQTHTYRLSAFPTEFEGKTLRIPGRFLTRVDETDGKRYFGCLLADPGGCSCCAPGAVLEFVPVESYKWPDDFPETERRITVSGRLKMFEVKEKDTMFSIPRLVDAEIRQVR